MANIEIRSTVNLDRPVYPVEFDGDLYAAEHQAHKFIISATSNDERVMLTGQVVGTFIRPDNYTVELSGSIVNGDAVLTLPASCYTVLGRFTLTIYSSISGGSKTAIYSCVGSVSRATTRAIIDPGSVVPDVSDIVAEYNAMQAAVTDANNAASAASAYSDAIAPFNAYNIVAQSDKSSVVSAGIHYDWDGLTCTISGSFDGASTSNRSLFYNDAALPDFVKPGSVIRLASDIYPILIIYKFNTGSGWPANYSTMSYNQLITVPANAVGFQALLYVTSNYTTYLAEHQVDHVDITPIILVDNLTNAETVDLIERRALALAGGNTMNLFGLIAPHTPRYNNGVTFTWAGNKCTISGSYTSGASYAGTTLYSSETSLPPGLIAGCRIMTGSAITPAYISGSFYDGTEWKKEDGSAGSFYFGAYQAVSVPDWAVGMQITLGVSTAYTGTTVTIQPELNILWNYIPQPRGVIASSGYDYNNAVLPGAYVLSGAFTYANSPFAANVGGIISLEVFCGGAYNSVISGTTTNSTYIFQRASHISAGEFIRQRRVVDGANTWSAWVMISPPPAPAANGTYTLRCVVSGGVPTYSWASV